MKKSLVILFSVGICIFFIFSKMENRGEKKIKRNIHEQKIHLKTIDPFQEKKPFKRSSKNFRTGKLKNQLYSTYNNTHSLTEVGVWGYGPSDTVYVDGNRAYIGSGRYLINWIYPIKQTPSKSEK